MDLEHNENEELEVTPAEPEAAPEAEPETAPVPEAEPEEKPEEKPAEKKPGMSKGAKIAIFLAALALAAAIAACVLLITGRKDHPAETEAPQTEATEATDGTTETVADKTLEAGEEVTTTYGKAANLIDADNFGKNAVTDNAAYTTGTAEAGDVQMRTVVARDATGYCLTNADLQIYYWMEFYQLMNNYGSYASMLGLDYTKALALQDAPSGGTWEQYFLTSATNNFAEIRACIWRRRRRAMSCRRRTPPPSRTCWTRRAALPRARQTTAMTMSMPICRSTSARVSRPRSITTIC